jgi:hypothetical protein
MIPNGCGRPLAGTMALLAPARGPLAGLAGALPRSSVQDGGAPFGSRGLGGGPPAAAGQ